MKTVVAELFDQVHKKKPLVHQITNFVTVNDCANATLAIGGSPVMTSSPKEVADMVKLAQALVLNLGTINDNTKEAMEIAGKMANDLQIPIIIDPVGVGSTPYRTEIALELLDTLSVQVIRGNASEIYRLMGGDIETTTRGVDSSDLSISNAKLALTAARKLNSVVVVSGAKDAISDSMRTTIIENGDSLLTKVTGTGCMATALIGAFCGATRDYYSAAIAGISTMSLSGELAARHLQEHEGTGTYRTKILDAISKMDASIWESEVNIHEEVAL